MSANLVLIPTPGMGHLVPAMQLAKQLVTREPRLSITVLLINQDLESLKSDPSLLNHAIRFMEAHESKVKEAVEGLIRSAGPVAGLLLDMLRTPMIDVAADLGLPSYVFFTSGASHLRTLFHFQELGSRVGPEEYDVVRNPDKALEIPGFRNPVPVKVWPGSLAKEGGSCAFLRHAEMYRKAKAILVNTFTELEPDKIDSLTQDNHIPPIYPVGPIITLADEDDDDSESASYPIMRWLGAQPPRSVVFLCFGSRGSFDDTQVREIAVGIERSGRRFLWSLRQGGAAGAPPEFLERTAERGRVIGWAPQARVLAHGAVGAFVSHCGWNSTLESLWHAVPIAAWPIYAEQQLNAFALVRELGLAAEIKIDYRQDLGVDMVVEAAQVEEGINKAMEVAAGVRRKVEEMSDKARKALREGGSSYESLGRFINLVFDNIP